MHREPLRFPAGFLWGTASSAHQVEGDNRRNQWWAWEQRPGAIWRGDTSGAACGWWHDCEADFDRMRVELLLAESLRASGRAEAAQVLAAELSARLDRIGAVPDHALRARLATLQSASD